MSLTGGTLSENALDILEAQREALKSPLLSRLVICNGPIKGSYLGNLLTSSLKTNQVEINTDSRTQKTVARLKEPRDLFTLPREPECAQEVARWPSECQVIEQKIQHIDAMPHYLEKYYEVTGKEIQPKPASDTDGTVVYSYNPMSAVNYFSRSTSRGNLVPSTPNPSGPDLKFESRFESGNLSKAIKITEAYYQLYLRTDLYTNRHTQWFYFMIENMRKNLLYRFSIVNLCKGESLYSVGMRPVMYSTKSAIEKKLGWHRCGTNITYFRNDNGSEEDDPDSTYTLSFQLEFPHDDDCVFLAHSYPYTYTNLQEYLVKLQNHPARSVHTKLRLLCKSLAGNNVYYLTVTEPQPPDEPYKKKKAVVITARVHPGETPSSYMMKGLIDFITGDSKAAKELRERFIFKLVPMLNPDGVIVGNSRCSLTGRDLNRQYRTVIRETYPPVWHTKVLIRRLMEDCGIALYCDFHAHSSKHNVFIYGCENKRNPEKRLQEQVFPLMLHKNSSDKFSFENCKFRIHKTKEGTGRVVMWMLGIENSYTLEASFAGSTLGLRTCTHFTTADYEAMGKSFCETLLDFLDDAPVKLKLKAKILLKLQKEGSNADEPANVSVSDYSSDDGEISDSSDDEKRKREDFCLTAPPPSPELIRTKTKIVKESSPKFPRHPPPVIIYSPPAQRKTMQIATATIDLEEVLSPGEDKSRESPQRSRPEPAAKVTSRVDSIHMPPELVITSTQDLSVFERLYKSAQLSREISKSPSRRDSCKRCSPSHTKRHVSPCGGLSESEGRYKHQSLHFRQQFWRVLSSGSMPWQNGSEDQDQLLKACSEKLADLKKKHKLKKIKYAEAAALSVPKLFFASRRLKRKSRSFTIGRSFSTKSEQESNEAEDVSKKKGSTEIVQQKGQAGKKTNGKSRKFRKGGIVTLATVHKQNPQETSNNEEENQPGKKKKKKKKLNQLQKHVKNAVHTVSIVRISNRKTQQTNSTHKQSSVT